MRAVHVAVRALGGTCVLLVAMGWALAVPTPDQRQSRPRGGGQEQEAESLPGPTTPPTVDAACDPQEPNWRSVLTALARQPGDAGARALGSVVQRRLEMSATHGPSASGADDSDPRLRDAIALLGARRGSSLAAGFVSPALGAADAGVRYAAVEALGTIGCACSRETLTGLVDTDPEPLVAAAAIGALSHVGTIDAQLLRAHVIDERAPVRSAAARVFARTSRPAALRDAPVEATEVHALRLLAATRGRRLDLDSLREFVHPMRHLEIWEEQRSATFSARTLTTAMLRQEIAPPLTRAAELTDSLTCGARRAGGEQHCAVYDGEGYVTELHFTTVLGRIFLLRVKHHGGYADL